jgi:hypothetical protein
MADNPDMGLGVAFFVKAVENPRKSKEAGRPVYDNKEFVQIRFPADNKRELSAPAHEMHYVSHYKRQMTYAERFKESYAAFKANNEEFVDGTPIAELPFLSEAQRAELRAQKIRTAEQLAQLPDSAVRRLGMSGIREMRTQAQAFLDRASGTVEVAELRKQVADLQKMLSATAAPPPETGDEFDGMSDDDLRNILTDAGQEADGRWGRKRLVGEIRDLAAKKTEAA